MNYDPKVKKKQLGVISCVLYLSLFYLNRNYFLLYIRTTSYYDNIEPLSNHNKKYILLTIDIMLINKKMKKNFEKLIVLQITHL
jgi:hypothetical protein